MIGAIFRGLKKSIEKPKTENQQLIITMNKALAKHLELIPIISTNMNAISSSPDEKNSIKLDVCRLHAEKLYNDARKMYGDNDTRIDILTEEYYTMTKLLQDALIQMSLSRSMDFDVAKSKILGHYLPELLRINQSLTHEVKYAKRSGVMRENDYNTETEIYSQIVRDVSRDLEFKVELALKGKHDGGDAEYINSQVATKVSDFRYNQATNVAHLTLQLSIDVLLYANAQQLFEGQVPHIRFEAHYHKFAECPMTIDFNDMHERDTYADLIHDEIYEYRIDMQDAELKIGAKDPLRLSGMTEEELIEMSRSIEVQEAFRRLGSRIRIV